MTSNLSTKVVAEAFAAATLAGFPVVCEYCHREVFANVISTSSVRATGDHRIPRSRGGPNSRANLAVACLRCNGLKGPLTAQEFLALRNDHGRLTQVRSEWSRRLNPNVLVYASRKERFDAKHERRQERLTARVRIPDPDCTACAGRGKIRDKRRYERFCQCSLEPLTEEAAAAHINGRHE